MASTSANARSTSSTDLVPFIPRLTLEWLREEPETSWREVEGTVAFIDISGFTAMSERLSGLGRAGAVGARGADAGAPCVIIRRGPRSAYLGAAFAAADAADVLRLANATGAAATRSRARVPDSWLRHSCAPAASRNAAAARGTRSK